jgi:hypothetical protein
VHSGFAGRWRVLIVGAAAVRLLMQSLPGTRYCFHGYCHRGGTLAQTYIS